MDRKVFFMLVLLAAVVAIAISQSNYLSGMGVLNKVQDAHLRTYATSHLPPDRIANCLTSRPPSGGSPVFSRASIASVYGGPKDLAILSQRGARVAVGETADGSVVQASSNEDLTDVETKRIETCARLGY